MLKTILNNLLSQLSTYTIACALCFFAGSYVSYKFTSDHYIAKIQTANVKAEEEKNAIQAKGDHLVARYVGELNGLRTQMADLQGQIPLVINHDQCTFFSLGFVRLYNSSASGEASAPGNFDGSASTVDEATLLRVLIENNEKYNQLSKQLIDLQEFLK